MFFPLPKISDEEEWSDSLCSIESGSCFIIWGGWFDDLLMYSRVSLGFLNGEKESVSRLRVKSRKSTECRPVTISMSKPRFLKSFTTFFLN